MIPSPKKRFFSRMARIIMSCAFLASVCPLQASAQDSQKILSLNFNLYGARGSKIEYFGTYTISRIGEVLRERQVYVTAAGQVVNIITTDFNEKTMKPLSFKSENLDPGYLESAEVKNGRVKYFFKSKKNNQVKSGEVDWEEGSFFYPNLVPTVLRQWPNLKKGETASFKLFLIPRGIFVDMNLKVVSNNMKDGRSITVMQAIPQNMVLRMLLDPFVMTFAKDDPMDLIEYKGLGAIKQNGKDHTNVRMEFAESLFQTI